MIVNLSAILEESLEQTAFIQQVSVLDEIEPEEDMQDSIDYCDGNMASKRRRFKRVPDKRISPVKSAKALEAIEEEFERPMESQS